MIFKMLSITNEHTLNRIVTVIYIIYFISGLCLVLIYGDSAYLGSLETFNNDDVKYVRSAWTLIEHKMLICQYPTKPTVFIMPGMPFLLALFILIFGKFSGLIAFRIFQVLLQTLSLILIFHLAQKIFNQKVAALAVLLDALYIPEIWITNIILTEVTFKFLLLCLIYLTGQAIHKRRIGSYFLVGLVWAIATLFRPTIALYALILPFLWWYSNYSLKEAAKYSLIISIVFFIIMSPWWIRNYQVFHRFIPLTLASGNPLLQGTYIGGDGGESEEEKKIDYSAYYSCPDDEIEKDRIEKSLAIERLKLLVPKNPLGYLCWYTIGKTFYQWCVPFLLGNLDYGIIVIATVFHWMILIGFIFGLIKLRFKPQNSWLILILLVIAYFNCMHLPFVSFSRYMYPVVSLLIIVSAHGILKIFESRKAKRQIIESPMAKANQL